MKKHTRFLLAALLLTLIPLRQFGQQPQQTKLTEFNFHNVNTIEERVFILHAIQESDLFLYRLSENEGKLDIYKEMSEIGEWEEYIPYKQVTFLAEFVLLYVFLFFFGNYYVIRHSFLQ